MMDRGRGASLWRYDRSMNSPSSHFLGQWTAFFVASHSPDDSVLAFIMTEYDFSLPSSFNFGSPFELFSSISTPFQDAGPTAIMGR